MPGPLIQCDPKRAIGYIRVSTDDQHLGQGAQRNAIGEWAARNGVEIRGWCVDAGVSGATALDERPGLVEALSLLQHHDAGILLLARRDRLARSVAVAVAAERAVEALGARIITADGVGFEDTAESRLVRSILDAVSEYERLVIRLRIRAAARVAKTNLQRWGTIPFGYDVDPEGQLIEAPQEQAIIDRIRELREEGHGYVRIAQALNAVTTGKHGGRWHAATVRKVYLANEARRRVSS